MLVYTGRRPGFGGFRGLGFAEVPANWATMTDLEKAIAQIQSADAIPAAEGMLWGGQCSVDVWGPAVCQEANAIAKGGSGQVLSPTRNLDEAVILTIRYNACLPKFVDSSLCPEAERLAFGAPISLEDLPGYQAALEEEPTIATETPLETPVGTVFLEAPRPQEEPAGKQAEWISGIPNWAVLTAGATLGAAFLFGGRGRR